MSTRVLLRCLQKPGTTIIGSKRFSHPEDAAAAQLEMMRPVEEAEDTGRWALAHDPDSGSAPVAAPSAHQCCFDP